LDMSTTDLNSMEILRMVLCLKVESMKAEYLTAMPTGLYLRDEVSMEQMRKGYY
jgi:hypothetical protein